MSRISKMTVGSVEVTALLDGEIVAPAELLLNLKDQDEQTIRENENNKLSYLNMNAFLVQKGDRNLLIDAGCRELFGPTCGFIQDALGEIELSTDDITDLFFTHLHPDHIAGALNTDGTAVFKNANLQVVEAEYNFWQADNFDAIEVNGADWAGVAKGVLNAYKDRLELTTSEKEIISGISLVDIPGHTPGHAGFRVDSDNESLLHLGDIMHFQNLQLIDPNVSTIFDIDYETALTSRKRILDMVSADGNLCTSGHWLSPKFGHIDRHGSGYAMVS